MTTSLFRRALAKTVPVMAGYLFLGTAYGIAMKEAGFSPLLTVLCSVLVYAGSMQFAMIGMFQSAFSPLTTALMALLIEARHFFYGLGMLDCYKDTGARKPYLVFGLTDETYSLVLQDVPADAEKDKWYFLLTLLDQCYWVLGSICGVLVGTMIPMQYLQGIDFVMTALFAVIVTEQVMDSVKEYRAGKKTAFEAFFPSVLGGAGTLLCLLLFGKNSFLLFSMALILLAFFLHYTYLRKGGKQA